MQQKNIKYFLLLGVSLIWGIVIYRILNGVNNNTDSPQNIPQKYILKTKDSSNYQPYSLLLNYEDPFGAEDEKTGLESSTNDQIKETAKFLSNTSVNPVRPDISFIKYKGIITNSITHKNAAIISINGKDELAKAGKTQNNIKINSIKKDKIQVTYLSEKYWIKRQ